ncbi:predicted protein [Streptomyces iranensis]|uniref:Uncharacterized protein n=1 Tax=Streptomyces iranensis TaxID=576784 RepID=A0A060ZKA8_9ACTN|nr:predicted protein [Streptomyces iranensis]
MTTLIELIVFYLSPRDSSDKHKPP